MSDSEGLIQISGCENPERSGDVVFIHGLGGHAIATWHPMERTDDNCWLTWLGQDLPDVGIWSLGYEAEAFAWKGNAMPLVDQALHTLAVLEADQIGIRPLIFVAHCLGGLLVKQMLVLAQNHNNPKCKTIVEQTKGIVFLSTPHLGYDFVRFILLLAPVLRVTEIVKELAPNHPRLYELNEIYRNDKQLCKIPMEIYYEKRKIYGFLLLTESSANPALSGVTPVPVNEDHISICRPKSKKVLIYIQVKRFIQKHLKNLRLSIQRETTNTELDNPPSTSRMRHRNLSQSSSYFKPNLTEMSEKPHNSFNSKIRKILIVAATPYKLRLDREIREIEEAISRSTRREQFEIKTRQAVRPKDIRRAIAEERPQIVHFCGQVSADGSLILEDDAGQLKPVLPEGLAALFELHADYVNCVLLNACYSKELAEAISQHINYVIGMNRAVDHKTAIEFAQGFYDALGYDDAPDQQDEFQRAFKEGVVAVQLENPSDAQIPIIKKKL